MKNQLYVLLVKNKIDLDETEKIVAKITKKRTRRIPELTADETAEMLKYLSHVKID